MDSNNGSEIERRPLLTGATLPRSTEGDGRPIDPLARAMPEWDLVPSTQFLRRR